MEALNQLAVLKTKCAELENELSAYGACDPVKVEEKKRAVILAKEAAIRWTGASLLVLFVDDGETVLSHALLDNYAMLLSHFTRQHGIDSEEIRRYLGVGDDYEDIL